MGGVILIAVLASAPPIREYVDNSLGIFKARVKRGITAGFLDQREPYFQVGWKIWKDHWLVGVGPGNHEDVVRGEYWKTVQSYRDRIPYFEGFRRTVKLHVHSLYLQLAISFGVLGLAAFLYFMARLGIENFRYCKHSIPSLAGLGLLLAILLHNFLDVTFPSLGLELGLLLGFALRPRPGSAGTAKGSD